jgi:predicted nucleic acid-binding protein
MAIEKAKKSDDILKNVRRIFLDTAPVIYFVEKNEQFLDSVKTIFGYIDDGRFLAITSPITLAECLVHPYRRELTQLQKDFFDLIVNGENTFFTPIDQNASRKAAQLQANYNVSLADAFQLAVAIDANCDTFLTNDSTLKRIAELKIIVIGDLE